jgi:hypothetical protein
MSAGAFLESFGEHVCFKNLELNDSFTLVEFLDEVHRYDGVNAIVHTDYENEYSHDGSAPFWFIPASHETCLFVTLADISDDFGLTALKALQARTSRYDALGSEFDEEY